MNTRDVHSHRERYWAEPQFAKPLRQWRVFSRRRNRAEKLTYGCVVWALLFSVTGLGFHCHWALSTKTRVNYSKVLHHGTEEFRSSFQCTALMHTKIEQKVKRHLNASTPTMIFFLSLHSRYRSLNICSSNCIGNIFITYKVLSYLEPGFSNFGINKYINKFINLLH